jgi:glucosyl-3-phosphoglycerate phosphatase
VSAHNGEAMPVGGEVAARSAGGGAAEPAGGEGVAVPAEGEVAARSAGGDPAAPAEGGAAAPAVRRYGGDSTRLVLWRHGQTQWNVEGRFQGQSDIPLDTVGKAQAERAARLLAALRPDVIVSSDLGRALATAAPLARLTGLTVTTDKDLRERHGGVWEGLTDAEIRARYPSEHAQWLPPDGESSAAVAERAGAALERIGESLPPGSLAVVVSHGAAIRLGAARLLGLPEALWGAVGPLANCAWSVVGQRRSRWRLLEHNAGTLPEPVLSDDR